MWGGGGDRDGGDRERETHTQTHIDRRADCWWYAMASRRIHESHTTHAEGSRVFLHHSEVSLGIFFFTQKIVFFDFCRVFLD